MRASDVEQTWFSDGSTWPSWWSRRGWDVLRGISVLVAVTTAVLVIMFPDPGLKVVWGMVVPLVPLTWIVIPGLWRNICPLATVSQLPRRLGFQASHRPRPTVLMAVGIAALLAIVVTRRFLFNYSGVATGALIITATTLALVSGLLFTGKSGWCTGMCPMLPVERLYGVSPLIRLRNSQCGSCVGCTAHCPDCTPGTAAYSELYGATPDERRRTRLRRWFVGVFPGFVAAYFLINPTADHGLFGWRPAIEADGIVAVVGWFVLFMAVSLLVFQVVDMAAGRYQYAVSLAAGGIAVSLFYGLGAPIFVQAWQDVLGVTAPVWVERVVGIAVIALVVAWWLRGVARERRFVAITAPTGAPSNGEPATVVLDDQRIDWPVGVSLLDALEARGVSVPAGCRGGTCGSDVVHMQSGTDLLDTPGAHEAATLQRLGCSPDARLACSARCTQAGEVRVAGQGIDVSGAADPTTDRVFVADSAVRDVVVVGTGVGGMLAAEQVRRRHPECNVTMIGREVWPTYNRMEIPRLVTHASSPLELALRPGDWAETKNITTMANTEVATVDRGRHTVALGTGQLLRYDRLILATGAYSPRPAIRGADAAGCFTVRTADDGVAIRAWVQHLHAERALVIGSGAVAVEVAEALSHLGLQVVLVARSRHLLRSSLDETASALLVQYLKSRGIDVCLGFSTREVLTDTHGRLWGVVAESGRPLPADLVVFAAGTKADTELASRAGLAVDDGIVVDEHMRTSDPAVFAVGDVARVGGVRLGLWNVAVEQAQVAAVGAIGGEARFAAHVPVVDAKVDG
ncbi:MAG: FAD-dependent oxidoreductase, partial [Micrococcales bacterium]|nr:FAD-dependent oxidoreductase [Micrococcales bacterium]